MLALAGCDQLFKLDHVESREIDAPLPVDANARGCFGDDFDGAELDTSRWTFDDVSPAHGMQADGEIQMDLGTSATYAYSLAKTRLFDLANTSASIAIVERPTPGTSAEVGIRYDVNSGADSYMIVIADNVVVARKRASFDDDDEITAYDATLHQQLRLRQEGTAMYFEASDSGSIWVTLRTIDPMPLAVSAAQVTLFAGTYEVVSNPGRARFDTFRMSCP